MKYFTPPLIIPLIFVLAVVAYGSYRHLSAPVIPIESISTIAASPVLQKPSN
jgi:hypothetical protein